MIVGSVEAVDAGTVVIVLLGVTGTSGVGLVRGVMYGRWWSDDIEDLSDTNDVVDIPFRAFSRVLFIDNAAWPCCA
jgi:hypothetical protein